MHDAGGICYLMFGGTCGFCGLNGLCRAVVGRWTNTMVASTASWDVLGQGPPAFVPAPCSARWMHEAICRRLAG